MSQSTTLRGKRASVPPAADPGRVQAARMLVHAGIWTGLAITIGIWWSLTSRGSLLVPGGELTAAGRLAGLVGGYLLLVQVLLMSRLPMLDQAIGAHRLSRWHRDLGGYIVLILITHATLITLGYRRADGRPLLPEIGNLLTRYQDMISAVIALGLLIGVGVLAIRAIRSRLPYEVWYHLHLTAYLVLLLAYGHQFNDGQEFVLSRPARLWWALLYLTVAGALLWGRVVRPLRVNWRIQARVDSVVTEAPGVVSVHLTGRDLDSLKAVGGQFFRWRFLDRTGWWRSHPFSLSAPPDHAGLRLTVKEVGDHTGRLQGLTPGTRVLLAGPAGVFTAQRRICERALLIAGGIGIAPIRALLPDLPPGAILVYRAHSEQDLVFRDELDEIAKRGRHRIWYLTGPRSSAAARTAFTARGLRKLAPDILRRDVYLCGPLELTRTVLASLSELGVPRRQIHHDPFEL